MHEDCLCYECCNYRFCKGSVRGVMDADPDEYWCEEDCENFLEVYDEEDCELFNVHVPKKHSRSKSAIV